MNAAKIPFRAMQYFGIWRPKTWTSPWAIGLYKLYSFLIIVLLTTFAATFLIYILRGAENLDALTENLIMFCGLCSVSVKIANIFLQRDEIISFDNMFLENCCIPRSLHECALQKEFEHRDRTYSIFLLTICFVGVTIITLSPLAKTTDISLPCDKIWMPYNIESNFLFSVTYIYQSISLFILGFLTVSFDSFISIMMQKICTQLQIFEHRLYVLPTILKKNHERACDSEWVFQIIADVVIHHIHVYSIGRKLNDIFSLMVFAQFFVTTLALCAIIFQLATLSMVSLKFWYMVGCLNNYMIEIFLYCWYGEQMIQQSAGIVEAVYEMNWNLLPLGSQKCLVLIMMRANKPIELIGASMVTMSVETLVKILKTSYSAFSVLKNVSGNP
ncbi:odorant receptor 67c-like [Belonocnema kinseyi]|uniref:odorant receptor 67c-like n=1 Tax=Belonocnema kinseyi TaxID=2817044 RepID=UPI00143D0749|nr:odorant receptor 67c-like [Belonocnema kinseyi]